MRIFSYVLGTLFILFAVVQFNDPDPWIWVPVYLIPAFMSFVFTHSKTSRILLLVLGLIYLIAAIRIFPPSINEWISAEEESKSLGMNLPGIETARESMGLFICALTMLFFWSKHKNPVR